MDRLSSERYITAFSKNAAPVLRVSDGATVCIAAKDCYMDNLRAENDPRGAAKGPAIGCNPASGCCACLAQSRCQARTRGTS